MTSIGADLRERFRARPVDGSIILDELDPSDTPLAPSESDAEDELEGDLADELFDQHELLFAEKERGVLLVLQGTDCAGKNGTIKHVVIHCNPAGVKVASFTEPTEEEEEHHFLWRYEQEFPRPGQLAVFDRSHYEDLLVPQAEGTISDDDLSARIDEINDFENGLVDDGTVIVKCLLHISYDEQRERFLRRLRRDDKRWKFAISDLETRALWPEYQLAYSRTIGSTSTDAAPWYVIPSDHKWYRNWAIAHILIDVLDSMGNAYPQPNFDLDDLRSRLEPPG